VKIAIPEMLLKLRQQLREEVKTGTTGDDEGEQLEDLAYRLWAAMLRRPWLYRAATWLATRTLGRWYQKRRWLNRLPGQLHGWTAERDFPAPASRRFRDWWREQQASVEA
jgi:L-lactate dehydrogenase complex protein LldF